MPLKIVANPARALKRTIACMGDSITFNSTLGVKPELFYPELLASKLRAFAAQSLVAAGSSSSIVNVTPGDGPKFQAGSPVSIGAQQAIILSVTGDAITLLLGLNTPPITGQIVTQVGCVVKARNFGRSGDTTQQTFRNAGSLTVAGSTASIINVTAATGGSFIAGPVLIGSQLANISSVAGDALTLLNPTLSVAPAIGLTVQQPTNPGMLARFPLMTFWEVPDIAVIYGGVNDPNATAPVISGAMTTTNLQSMIATLLAAGCTRIIVVKQHYMNFGGGFAATRDTTTAGVITQGTYSVPRVSQANAQLTKDGVNPWPAGQVVLSDALAYFNSLIGTAVTYKGVAYTIGQNADTTPAQGNSQFSWHVADGNLHLNPLGEELLARCILATIQAQPGWIAALQS